MKFRRNPLQLCLLVAQLLLPGAVQAQFTFTTNNGAITITGYTGSGGDVIIPSVINGYPVKNIGLYAFNPYPTPYVHQNQVTSVVIPDSVTNIELGAFYECSELTNVVMSTNVTELAVEVFGFSGLTSFTFPSGLIKIAGGAFDNCLNLTNVVIPSGVQYIGDYAFNDSYSMNSVTIPDSVTYLGDWAYSGCINITNLTIGNGISSILGNEFSECTSLQNVIISDSVTNIEGGAFALCYSLTNITYGSGVGASIGSLRFNGTTNLKTITVSSNNPVLSSLDGVLFDKNQTTLIQCPVGKAGSYAIPSTVTSIWKQAFLNCSGLTEVLLNSSISSSGGNIFTGCSGITNITLLDGVTNIPFGLFYPCVNLESFTASPGNPCYSSVNGVLFDKNQTTLIQYPYNGNGNYSVPNGITSIWYGAFAYCSNLDSITLPNSLADIGALAFFNCSGLTNMVIPGAVASIGDGVFDSCVNLATVQIGSSVTNLGAYAFEYCQDLASVYFKGNAPAADDSTFFYYPPNPFGSWIIPATIFYVPGTTGWSNTFAGCQTATWIPPSPFNYIIHNGTVMITGYTGSNSMVVIPDQINSLPVTSIGSGAFDYSPSLTSVTIPNSVISIGSGIFLECPSLTNLTVAANNPAYSSMGGVLFDVSQANLIECPSGLSGSYSIPNTVTNIGSLAFYGCDGLTSVMIPNSVTSIGSDAFMYCYSLTNLTVAANNPAYSSMGGVLFDVSQANLIECPSGLSGSYSIPNTVTNIGSLAFYGCDGLTGVAIPNSVASIGSFAFAGCNYLTSVTIPNSVTSIGEFTFDACGLTNVVIGSGVTNIDGTAFMYCDFLTSVTFGCPNVLSWFSGSQAANVILLNTVTNIGSFAFYGAHLTSVTIPNSVTSIGDYAFGDCNGLTNVVIGSGVTSIGSDAFEYCPHLSGIYFQGNSPTLTNDLTVFSNDTHGIVYYLPGTIGWDVSFDGLPTALWIPPVPFNYITNNGTLTITGYTGTNSVVSIPGKINSLPVTSIGFGAFSTTNVTSVTIPSSVTIIEDMAFYGCVDLASITIPTSVTNIGTGAFNSCLRLRTVTIPASVTSIGDYAFFYCTNLTNISVVAANPRFSSAQGVLFNKHKTILLQFPFAKAGSYAIPGTVTNLADEAFGMNDHGFVLDPYMVNDYRACPGLTHLTIPGSLTHIGDHAFSHCTGLTSVILSKGVASFGVEAFSWCTNLPSITIPGSVRNIGDLAFYYAGLKKVTIPGSVTNLGLGAFAVCSRLTTVTMQNGVKSIGEAGFNFSTNLTSIFLPDSLQSIGDRAFWFCAGLTNVTIPRHVAHIGSYAFSACAKLKNINVSAGNASYHSVAGVLCNKNQTVLIQFPGGRGGSYWVPSGITTIGDNAFGNYDPGFYSYDYPPACANLDEIIFPASVVTIGFENFNSLTNMTRVYFEGDAPADFGDLAYDGYVTIYYLLGATGWDTTLIGVPTAPWLPQMQTIRNSFGGQKNKFGFNISWTSKQKVVVVEASTNLIDWQPVQTNTLTTGSAYFSDPQWTNYTGRFYRLRSP